MPLTPFLVPPVNMLPSSNTGEYGFSPLFAANSAGGGPFPAAGGKLFASLIYQGSGSFVNPAYPVHVVVSSDNGAHWSIADGANAPAYGGAATPQETRAAAWVDSFIDGSGNTVYTGIVIGLSQTDFTGAGPASGAVNWYRFDFGTQTWSAASSSAGNRYLVYGTIKRPDGSIVVLSASSVVSGHIVGLTADIWKSGAWTSVDCTVNAPGGEKVIAASAGMDITGRIHIIMLTTPIPGTFINFHTFEQCLETDNSLGASTVISAANQSFGSPICIGTTMYLPFVPTTDVSTYIAGTPLNAPVWSAPINCDLITPPAGSQCSPPFLGTDGLNLFAAYTYTDNTDTTITARLVQVGSAAIDAASYGFEDFNCTIDVTIGSQLTYGGAQDDNAGDAFPSPFWFGTVSGPTPPTPGSGLRRGYIDAGQLPIITLPNPAINCK